MSDGWTGPTRLSIINVMVYSAGKTAFLKSIDASDKIKNWQLVWLSKSCIYVLQTNSLPKFDYKTHFIAEWWNMFGIEASTLRRLAMRIISQASSSSACERNWTTFALVHTKQQTVWHTKGLNNSSFIPIIWSYNSEIGKTGTKIMRSEIHWTS